MVERFVLGWTLTAQRGVETAVVPPVDPFQGGEFDLLDAAPGPAAFDSGDAEFGEPVGVANRQILTAPVAVMNQLMKAAHPCPRRGLAVRRISFIRRSSAFSLFSR